MAQTPLDWKESRFVESYDVDLSSRLRPHVLFSYLLNSAWNHAQGSSLGFAELSARNLIWVLIKFQMVVHAQPRWRDQLLIETWGKGIQRLYALRDFRVSAPSGEKLVSATSSWLVLDRNTGRPQRIDPKADGFPWQPQKAEMETDLEKLPEVREGRKAAAFRVQFSDIDVNRHVGSARYLQWVMDSHSMETLEGSIPVSIELNFLTEAVIDDEVLSFAEQGPDSELLSLRRASDSRELCRARLRWAKAEENR